MSPATHESDVERAALDLFESLGWRCLNVFDEVLGENGTLGRETKGDVILTRLFRAAVTKLNPEASEEAINEAIEQVTRDRSAMNPAQANGDVYLLLKDGVQLKATGAADDAEDSDQRIRLIDWNCPENNDFFVAQQFWVTGDIYTRRADLVGFVNGLPLVFIELKGIHSNIQNAYSDNLRDYLGTIPQLFWYNALILLSNGIDSRIGTLTGAWEHFKEWKRIEREDEPRRVSLEVMLRGVCDKTRLLDLIENFTLYSERKSDLAKIVGQNHQYLGVNNSIAAVRKYQLASSPPPPGEAPAEYAEKLSKRRRLGVFWHTPGSGKSFSMVFFAQKILRKLHGNWTFVILTDREELDQQICKTFKGCGATKDEEVQAKSAKHLQQLLTEDHRYVFTLIQKFRTDVKGGRYPKLSDRSDIIVMADEAHRSQYDIFAMNLRNALPNAAFIGFTGTPLMAGEEKTREEFGDYISIYNFNQAMEDNATVPLFYDARIPELQLSNDDLAEDLAALVEDADLDEAQQSKVEQEFGRQYHLITRDDRLDTIANDIVEHFIGQNLPTIENPRVTATKGMVLAIDKVTAVRMYNKVTAAWTKRLERAKVKSHNCVMGSLEHREAQRLIDFLVKTDMAVVVSQEQNEGDTFKKKGIDIAPHRKRMMKEDLDTKFKDDKDPFRLVFVCAMWMVGFDVPSCGVIYLDKPMRNHNLMQTMCRANRVFENKISGQIVDYVGVFRNLQKALAIYGTGTGDGGKSSPVQPKEVQLQQLGHAIGETKHYCTAHSVEFDATRDATKLQRIALIKDGIDRLVHPEYVKKTYLQHASGVDSLYKALGTDQRKNVYSEDWGVISDLAAGLKGLAAPVDISQVMQRVEQLLDDSIEAYEIPKDRVAGGRLVDLGKIDFDALNRFFKRSKRKAATTDVVVVSVRRRVANLVSLNPTRGNLHDQLERLIAEYNAGAHSTDQFFQELLAFVKTIEKEEQRPTEEKLTTEQLTFYDLMRVSVGRLSDADRDAVKSIARALPATLEPALVIDWRKSQRARAKVKAGIKDALDSLPDAYTGEQYELVVESLYEHVYESYFGEGESKYVANGHI
jgi:type I restriction enzyme, R subunit